MKRYVGEFLSVNGGLWHVELRVPGDGVCTIGDGGLWFGAEPVVIHTETCGVTEPVVRQSASVRLLLADYDDALLCGDCSLVVRNGEEVVFAGVLEPSSQNVPWVDVAEEVELNFIDALSALQYRRWGGAVTEDEWSLQIGRCGMVSLADVIGRGLRAVCDDIDADAAWRLLWDGSRSVSEEDDGHDSLLSWKVSELLLYGDSVDDVWTELEAVEEVCRWLGVQIVQEGTSFLLYDPRNVSAGSVTWRDLWGEDTLLEEEVGELALTLANSGGADAALTVSERYSRVKVTAELSGENVVIESPTEDAIDVYGAASRLCTVYWSKSEYEDAAKEKFAMAVNPYHYLVYTLNPDPWSIDEQAHSASEIMAMAGECHEVNWYIRLLRGRRWRLPWNRGSVSDVTDLCKEDDQVWLPYAAGVRGGIHDKQPFMVSVAKGEREMVEAETRTEKLEWKDILVLPVNRDGTDVGADLTWEKDRAKVMSMVPLAVFDGGVPLAVSPSDDDTVNYIVISGNLTLRAAEHLSGNYNMSRAYSDWLIADPETRGERPSIRSIQQSARLGGSDTDDYVYRCVRWWEDGTNEWGLPVPQRDDDVYTDMHGWWPMDADSPKSWKYERNSDGTTVDKVWKVDVLSCMLRVGDKVCVEDVSEGKDGGVECFSWVDYKPLEECADMEEWMSQCIHIGINPKINDWLLGKEWPIASNVNYRLGIDASGMAIPVRLSDHLEGAVHFEILAVDLLEWDDTIRKHGTWFRNASYITTHHALWYYLKSVELSELKVSLVSDNGGVRAVENDLVYMSESGPGRVNELEVTCRVTSALTTAEMAELGVTDTVCRSTVVCGGVPVTSYHDVVSGEDIKAERLLASHLWEELHAPRVELEVPVDEGCGSWLCTVSHPALDGKTLRVEGIDRDLRVSVERLKLREIVEE